MPTTVKPVPAFFSNDAIAPPPFPPMLTDQLELFGSRLPPRAECFETGIHRPRKAPKAKSDRVTQDSKALQSSKIIRSPSSYHRKTTVKNSDTRSSSRASTVSSSSSSSELTSASSSEGEGGSELSDDSKIPKPPGEPGRPGRGGYNLGSALDWNAKAFARFKTVTHRLIGEHLDVSKCISVQSPALLKVVRDKALDAFPDLDNYQNCWPVNDLIMMHLKYTSSRARRQEVERAAGRANKAKVSK